MKGKMHYSHGKGMAKGTTLKKKYKSTKKTAPSAKAKPKNATGSGGKRRGY